MKELAEKYRLVKGGTIRSEATKDKVRTLAPAVYANETNCTKVNLSTDKEIDSRSTKITERSGKVVGKGSTCDGSQDDCSVTEAVGEAC